MGRTRKKIEGDLSPQKKKLAFGLQEGPSKIAVSTNMRCHAIGGDKLLYFLQNNRHPSFITTYGKMRNNFLRSRHKTKWVIDEKMEKIKRNNFF
jgi:hypothetical protein